MSDTEPDRTAASRLPRGTVTFLFSDVEGSTELLQRLGDEYATELDAHREIVRRAVESAGGELVDQRGEEDFAAFGRAADAVAAATSIQKAHVDRVMKVRIGLHTGEPALTGDSYLGLDVHRAARICAAGHGGQVLLSQTTSALVGTALADHLGDYHLKGIATPEPIFALRLPGSTASRPLRAVPADKRRSRFVRGRAAEAPRHTLDQLAWSVRARLAATPASERPAVSKLSQALSVAARAAGEADHCLARVDRRGLERRRDAYRAVSGSSRRAAAAAEATDEKLDLIDSIAASRTVVERAARRKPPETNEISTAAEELASKLAKARVALADSMRLRRTLHRGVYRVGDEYVVRTFDETGIEHLHSFATRTEARSFRQTVFLAERARLEMAGAPHDSVTRGVELSEMGTSVRPPRQR